VPKLKANFCQIQKIFKAKDQNKVYKNHKKRKKENEQ
jgi:hypothetical protein